MDRFKNLKHIPMEMMYAFIGTLLIGFLGHMYIFTHNFVNWDGITCFYIDDMSMVESGRWLLGGAAAISGKFTMPFVIGTLSLIYMAIGNSLLVSFFEVKKKINALLIAGLVVLSPIVTGTFTYMFTADAYFLAYLLSILAAFGAKRINKLWVRVPVAGGLLCASLGIYQAYGAVAIILLMLDSVILLLTAEDTKKIIMKIGSYIGSIMLGFFSYMIIMNIFLKWRNVTLNDYQGISGLNSLSLGNMLKRIPKQYEYTWKYITTSELTHYNFFMFICFICILIIGIALLLYLSFKTHKIYRFFWIMLDLVALPIALNMFNLVSDDTTNHLLMKMSWLMPIVLIICLSERIEAKYYEPLQIIMAVAVLVITFFYYQMANIVYVNIEQRQERTYTLATRLLWRMDQIDGYFDGIPIVVTGLPWIEASNWLPGELYGIPGAIGRYYVMSGYQFVQVYFNYLGVPFNYQWDSALVDDIMETTEYREMGIWPDKNSMKIINEVLVIRFPDL